MKKRVIHYKGPDWWDYPPEWDEQAKKLCQQDDIEPSISTSKMKIFNFTENIEAKRVGRRPI